MHTTLVTDWHELADRSVDGLDVRLWWSSSTGRVQITVADHRGGDHLVLDVDGAEALDAFRHPFAYGDRAAGCLPRPRRRRHLAPVPGTEEQ